MTRPFLWLPAFGFVILSFFGSASALTTFTGSVDFKSPSSADATAMLDIKGQDAADLRASIDQNGDNDGTVTASEVEAFETLAKEGVGKETEEGFGEELTVDGRASETSTINRFDISGAEGPVSGTGSIKMDILLLMEFPVTAGASHTFTFKDTPDDSSDETVYADMVVKMPPGYIVTAPATMPAGVTLSSDKRTLTFDPNVEQNGDLIVTATKGAAPGGKSPLPPVVALCALVALALVRKARA